MLSGSWVWLLPKQKWDSACSVPCSCVASSEELCNLVMFSARVNGNSVSDLSQGKVCCVCGVSCFFFPVRCVCVCGNVSGLTQSTSYLKYWMGRMADKQKGNCPRKGIRSIFFNAQFTQHTELTKKEMFKSYWNAIKFQGARLMGALWWRYGRRYSV